MKIERRFRCEECGKIFNWPKEVQEYRGEFWGMPCSETVYYSPCCEADFEELTDDEDPKEVGYEHLE